MDGLILLAILAGLAVVGTGTFVVGSVLFPPRGQRTRIGIVSEPVEYSPPEAWYDGQCGDGCSTATAGDPTQSSAYYRQNLEEIRRQGEVRAFENDALLDSRRPEWNPVEEMRP